MMKITLEQVESLRKRVDCDYQTAERALRKSGGNEDQAVLHILKRREKKWRKGLEAGRELISKVLGFQLVLVKNAKAVIRVPVLLIGAVVVLLDIPMVFVLVLALASVVMGYEYEVGFREEEAEPMERPQPPDEDKTEEVPAQEEAKDEKPQPPDEGNQQDYEEIIID